MLCRPNISKFLEVRNISEAPQGIPVCSHVKNPWLGTSLVVQWLRLCSHCRGHGFNPWLVSEDPVCHVVWPKNNFKKSFFKESLVRQLGSHLDLRPADFSGIQVLQAGVDLWVKVAFWQERGRGAIVPCKGLGPSPCCCREVKRILA